MTAPILYGSDGAPIEPRPSTGSIAGAIAIVLALAVMIFLAGWIARGNRDRVIWHGDGYEISEPAYFPPSGHKPIV